MWSRAQGWARTPGLSGSPRIVTRTPGFGRLRPRQPGRYLPMKRCGAKRFFGKTRTLRPSRQHAGIPWRAMGRGTVGCRRGYLPPGRVETSPCGGSSCVDFSPIVPWRPLDAVFSRSRFLDGEEPVLEVRVSVLHVGLQPRGGPHVERRGYLLCGWGGISPSGRFTRAV